MRQRSPPATAEHDRVGEITILDAQKSGIYPPQIDRVLSDAAGA